MSDVEPETATNVAWLRVAVIVFGVVVLLWGNNVSPSRLWWSLAMVLVLIAVAQVLVGAGRGAGTAPEKTPRGPTGTGEAVV
jgi:hypothetical protein